MELPEGSPVRLTRRTLGRTDVAVTCLGLGGGAPLDPAWRARGAGNPGSLHGHRNHPSFKTIRTTDYTDSTDEKTRDVPF